MIHVTLSVRNLFTVSSDVFDGKAWVYSRVYCKVLVVIVLDTQ